MKYERYDVKFKIDSVKNYIDLKNNSIYKVGYGSYAQSINVNKATFVTWVKKYKESKLYDDDSEQVNDPSSMYEITNNSNTDFINLSEGKYDVISNNKAVCNSNIINNSNSSINKNMKLTINGATIDFDPAYLSNVIEVLKKC